MDMKKLIVSILLAILPPSFILFTIPLSSIQEHVLHIVIFAVIGFTMSWYYAKSEIKQLHQTKHKLKLAPSFTTLVFAILIIFAAMHAMPCPYMFSPQTAQTMIDHPCSQPIPTSTPMFSLNLTEFKAIQVVIPMATISIYATIKTADNRSPPFS